MADCTDEVMLMCCLIRGKKGKTGKWRKRKIEEKEKIGERVKGKRELEKRKIGDKEKNRENGKGKRRKS